MACTNSLQHIPYVDMDGPVGTLSGILSPASPYEEEEDAKDAKIRQDALESIEKDPILFEKVNKLISKAKQGTPCALSCSDRWRLNYIQIEQVSKTMSIIKDESKVYVIFGHYAWDGASEHPVKFVREMLFAPIATFGNFAANVANPINIGLNLFVMAAYHPRTEYLAKIQRNKWGRMPGTHALASFLMTVVPICVFLLQIFFFAAFGYHFVSNISVVQDLLNPSLNSTSTDYTCSATEWSSGEIIIKKIVAANIAIWFTVGFWNRALDIYFYTLRLEYSTTRSYANIPRKRWKVLPRERFLNFAVFDWWAASIFDHLAILLNVFFVMSASSVLNMVFNSLAVNFFSTLDDAYRQRYFANEVIRDYMTGLCLTTVTAIPDATPTLKLTEKDYFKKRCCCLTEMPQVYVATFLPALVSGFGAIAVFICTPTYS